MGVAEGVPSAGSKQHSLKPASEPLNSSGGNSRSSSNSSSGAGHSNSSTNADSNSSSANPRGNSCAATASPRSPRAARGSGGAAGGTCGGAGPPAKRVRTDAAAGGGAAVEAGSSWPGAAAGAAAGVAAGNGPAAAAAAEQCPKQQQQQTGAAEGQQRGAAGASAAGGVGGHASAAATAAAREKECVRGTAAGVAGDAAGVTGTCANSSSGRGSAAVVTAGGAGGSAAAAEAKKGVLPPSAAAAGAAADEAAAEAQPQQQPEKKKKQQQHDLQKQQQDMQHQQQQDAVDRSSEKLQGRAAAPAVAAAEGAAARGEAAPAAAGKEERERAAAAAAGAAADGHDKGSACEEGNVEAVKTTRATRSSRNTNSSSTVDAGAAGTASAAPAAATAPAAAPAAPAAPAAAAAGNATASAATDAAATALAELLRGSLLANGERRGEPVECAAAANILKSEVPNTVFKVFCTHCEPHYSQPWATRRQTTSTSSGFVTVDSENNRCLLTNAHSVEHAAVVQVRKRGDHRKYEAKVLCVGLDCDLAMLQVSDSDFWEGVGPPLQWGPSPLLEDPVTVVGYPLGGDNSSVTQGVVSRTDLQQYSMGSSSLLAIQIDAAINPGNSGGPALNKFRQCVGIAFQSLRDGDTENIGYIIPSEVVRHFLEDYRRHGKYLGFGDGGFSWQKLENRYLRQALGLTSRHDGILIKKLDGASAASKVLRKGDMLLEVNGQSIASDGTVPFRNGERILFTWLFSQMFVGDTCKVKIIREGEGEKELSFTVGKLNLLVPANSELARPEYLVVGGLVFVTLSEPFLKSEYGDDFDARAPVRLLDRWQHGFQSFPGEQYVVLTHVLAHSLTVGYEHLHNTQVKAFNGTAIKTLRHLADLVDASQDEYWRFDLDHEEVVILQAKAARAALPQILQRNMIPTYKSFAS